MHSIKKNEWYYTKDTNLNSYDLYIWSTKVSFLNTSMNLDSSHLYCYGDKFLTTEMETKEKFSPWMEILILTMFF